MKSFGMFLTVIAVLALGTAASQAGLVSLYTFDNTANNSVAGAQDGTLVDGPTYVAGIVGTKAISFNGSNYMDVSTGAMPQPDAYGSNAGGIWSGSCTLWLKTTDTSVPTIARGRNIYEGVDSWLIGGGWEGTKVDQNYMHLHIREASGSQFYGSGNAPGWNNGSWHQVVYTWNVTAGGADTGTMTFYLDGVARSVANVSSSITSDSIFSPGWDAATVGCGVDWDGYSYEPYTGAIDDMAIWNNQLTATDAKVLYNLTKDAPDSFNASLAATVFDVAETGEPASSSNGWRWWRAGDPGVPEGPIPPPGSPGDVIGFSPLGGGSYVAAYFDNNVCVIGTVPEPGTLALLAIAGLLYFACMKRK